MIVDLHNDLLSYLVLSPNNSPHDEITGSSIGSLRAGGVSHLVLTTFTETLPNCETALTRQQQIFLNLPKQYSQDFSIGESSGTIQLIPAIENCSAFARDDELLKDAFKRFDAALASRKILYASLTWNTENRFGGGAHTAKGLTSDGEALLDFLCTRTFAVDLSHASDALAGDVLKYLDRTSSPLRVIASHSNFRSVMGVPRNIPDEIAQEIVQRDGVIGLTCIKKFIGNVFADYFKHVDHALKNGWEDSLAIGADFFWYPNLYPNNLKNGILDEEKASGFDRSETGPYCNIGLFPIVKSRELSLSPKTDSSGCLGIASKTGIFQDFVDEHYFPGFEKASSLPIIIDQVRDRYGAELSQKIARHNAVKKLILPFEAFGKLGASQCV